MPLLLSDSDLQELDTIVGEIPTKYGVNFIRFFSVVRQARANEGGAEKLKTEKESETLPPDNKLPTGQQLQQ